MAPFRYAYKLCIRERKSRKIVSFAFVCTQIGYNVFLYQNIIIHYKYLNNNLRTFVEFLDQSIYALFCPAPPRPAPPRPADFHHRPGPPRWKKAPPRPSLDCTPPPHTHTHTRTHVPKCLRYLLWRCFPKANLKKKENVSRCP